eukprot:1169136-Prymnesium_polylepis.1
MPDDHRVENRSEVLDQVRVGLGRKRHDKLAPGERQPRWQAARWRHTVQPGAAPRTGKLDKPAYKWAGVHEPLEPHDGRPHENEDEITHPVDVRHVVDPLERRSYASHLCE